MKPRRATLAFFSVLPLFSLGTGCPNQLPGPTPGPDPNASLAGRYSVTRSDIQVTFTWTVNQGGEVQSQSTTSTLQPVDPAAFPPELAPLVDQWNAGLANLNARLDSAFAPEVIASFPAAFTLRLTDAGDPNRFIEGLFDEYDKFLFLGDMSGDAAGSDQGGGAALVVSSVDGQIDRAAKTARGKIARTLLILLVGVPDSAAALTAQISVDFTATRIGDAAAQ